MPSFSKCKLLQAFIFSVFLVIATTSICVYTHPSSILKIHLYYALREVENIFQKKIEFKGFTFRLAVHTWYLIPMQNWTYYVREGQLPPSKVGDTKSDDLMCPRVLISKDRKGSTSTLFFSWSYSQHMKISGTRD